MVQNLFELASHNVRNAVVDDGRIFDVIHLPTTLRIWLFELFRMKRLLNNRNVTQIFRQPGFFDGFTTINMDIQDDTKCYCCGSDAACDGGFIRCLVTILSFSHSIAENLNELSLSYSAKCWKLRNEPVVEKCLLMEDIGTLLAMCRNLKRLRLVTLGTGNYGDVFHDFSKLPVTFSALEHLSVHYHERDLHFRRFPKRWFEAITSLELHGISCRDDAYFYILTSCEDTLTSLSVSDYWISGDCSAIPVALPELSSLSLQLKSASPEVFSNIVEHCPKLTTAKLKLPVKNISKAELAALANLADRLQLHLIIKKTLDLCEIVKVAGESVVGLDFGRCEDLISEECDEIFRCCTNLNSFSSYIERRETNLIRKFFDNKDRLEKLVELELTGFLSKSMLEVLFTNCCNLQKLTLLIAARDQMFDADADINHLLKMWTDNGAQPSSVALFGFNFRPESVCDLMKLSGRNLKRIQLRMREKMQNSCYDVLMSTLVNCCPYGESCFVELWRSGRRAICPSYMLAIDKYKQLRFMPLCFDKCSW